MSAATLDSTNQISAWDTAKAYLNTAYEWTATQVVWLKDVIADTAFKIYEFVKPAFQAMLKWGTQAFEMARDFVMENKNGTIIGAVAFVLGAVVYGVFQACLCPTKKPATP